MSSQLHFHNVRSINMSPTTQLIVPIIGDPTKSARSLSNETSISTPHSIKGAASIWFSHNWAWFVGLLFIALALAFIFVFLYCRTLLRLRKVRSEMKKQTWYGGRSASLEEGVVPMSSTRNSKTHQSFDSRKWWHQVVARCSQNV